MYLHDIKPGTPEADALTVRIWTNLIKIAAREKGFQVDNVTVYRDGKKLTADPNLITSTP